MLGQVNKGHSARREELKAIDQQFLRKKKRRAQKSLIKKREKETHGAVFQMSKNAAYPYKMCIIIQ